MAEVPDLDKHDSDSGQTRIFSIDTAGAGYASMAGLALGSGGMFAVGHQMESTKAALHYGPDPNNPVTVPECALTLSPVVIGPLVAVAAYNYIRNIRR